MVWQHCPLKGLQNRRGKKGTASWCTIRQVAVPSGRSLRKRARSSCGLRQEPDMRTFLAALFIFCLTPPAIAKRKPPVDPTPSLEQYVREVTQRSHQASSATPGSLFTSTGRLADGF